MSSGEPLPSRQCRVGWVLSTLRDAPGATDREEALALKNGGRIFISTRYRPS